jgi:hypothetical protein
VQLVLQNEDFFAHFDFLFGKENERLSGFHLPKGDLKGRVSKSTWIDLVILSVD